MNSRHSSGTSSQPQTNRRIQSPLSCSYDIIAIFLIFTLNDMSVMSLLSPSLSHSLDTRFQPTTVSTYSTKHRYLTTRYQFHNEHSVVSLAVARDDRAPHSDQSQVATVARGTITDLTSSHRIKFAPTFSLHPPPHAQHPLPLPGPLLCHL